MYPSVSICKKYAFETLVFDSSQQNIDINQLVQSVQNNTWTLDQQFYFFTHPGAMNKTFPCTTTLGGTTPGTLDHKVPQCQRVRPLIIERYFLIPCAGRPCIFPVTYRVVINC